MFSVDKFTDFLKHQTVSWAANSRLKGFVLMNLSFQIYDESKYLTSAISTFLQVHCHNPSVSLVTKKSFNCWELKGSALAAWCVVWVSFLAPCTDPYDLRWPSLSGLWASLSSSSNKDGVGLWIQHRLEKWSPETHGRERVFCDLSGVDQKWQIPYMSQGQTWSGVQDLVRAKICWHSTLSLNAEPPHHLKNR